MAKITMFFLILFMAILLAGTVYAESPTVFGNSKGVVHKGSGGNSMVSPDICNEQELISGCCFDKKCQKWRGFNFLRCHYCISL